MLETLRGSALFWIALSGAAYALGVKLRTRFNTPVLNPLLIAAAIIIVFLKCTGLTAADYNTGGEFINMLLAPATAALAYSLYRQRAVLGRYFLPIAAGCTAGAATSIISVMALCHLFGLDSEITAALIPKSITTSIALEICATLGGLRGVTVTAVMLTGIFGAVAAPVLIKLFKIDNPVAAGTAIGACSHAVGTSKAVELGETEGAASAAALCVTGIITVIISLFL